MDCVLAISGAHLGCSASGSEIQLASSTHYALALRNFKHTLTKTVSGKDSKPVNLLLTALMLCHVESISGNDQGAIFHHLRASSHFVGLMLAQNSNQVGHELPGFLLETYAYLVSVVNITTNTDSDPQTVIFDPFTNALDEYRDSKVYGATMGCAQVLFELIPSVCQFGYRRIAEESNNECSSETMALYKSLESKIQNWQPPNIIIREDYSAKDRITAAKVYQQALLIFLHANFYASKNLHPTFLALVETSLESSFQLVANLPEDTPIMATLLWPTLIIGSCLRHPLHKMFLRHRMLASPYNMVIVSKTVQLLDWLWEEEEFGPYGLGNVMKKHRITHCMG
ncbi:hypothetical protein N431DRAFT_423612 [Stipitochalara longipes BDJ]|nr:hypothetical protein N431DRAFT_423612 [Stipitochalara longipes BDJ]